MNDAEVTAGDPQAIEGGGSAPTVCGIAAVACPIDATGGPAVAEHLAGGRLNSG